MHGDPSRNDARREPVSRVAVATVEFVRPRFPSAMVISRDPPTRRQGLVGQQLSGVEQLVDPGNVVRGGADVEAALLRGLRALLSGLTEDATR